PDPRLQRGGGARARPHRQRRTARRRRRRRAQGAPVAGRDAARHPRAPPAAHGAVVITGAAAATSLDGSNAIQILLVLGFIRSGLGTPTAPPNQVLVGIALFLTLFVMQPTFAQIKKESWDPLQQGKITQVQALDRAQGPMREFMFRQTRTKDIALFAGMAKLDRPKTRADIPTYVLIPAFIISELKTAFQIGFLIFLPFLVIDLVVSSTLMSMGMVMLPPVF